MPLLLAYLSDTGNAGTRSKYHAEEDRNSTERLRHKWPRRPKRDGKCSVTCPFDTYRPIERRQPHGNLLCLPAVLIETNRLLDHCM